LLLTISKGSLKLGLPKSPKNQKVANLKFYKAIEEGKNAVDRQIAKKAARVAQNLGRQSRQKIKKSPI